MWNPFKNKSNNGGSQSDTSDNDELKDAMPKMNMLQRMAMKRLEKMNPKEQQKMMQEAFKPENKGKIMAALEMMKKTGQVTDEQIELAKQKLGIKD